tara:strand:+ start:60 stop:1169 length:1110 start_codon:yes stop_codon:yes gene_type:complete
MSNAWGDGSWGNGFWGNQADNTVTLDSLSTTVSVSSVSVDAQIGTGWGRDAWNSLAWGVAFSAELGSLQSTFSAGTLSVVADALVQPTGLSVTSALGTAVGEPENVYFPTGVSFETQLSGVTVNEGAGVVAGSLLMSFVAGDETASGTVDVGWGRGSWGSFAWNENIEFFANVTGVTMATSLGTTTVTTGTGVIVNATPVTMSLNAGTLVVSEATALVNPTALTIGAALSGASGITGEGNVGVIAPSDQLDFSIGSLTIDIFTQVDPTSVVSTLDLGAPTVSGTAVETLASLQMSTAAGSVTIETGTGVIVSVSTVALTFAEGSETIIADAVVEPTGATIVSILGDTFETPWANVVTGASNTWTEVDAA